MEKRREKRRIGIVGFGSLGQYLYESLINLKEQYEVVFIWNRTVDKLTSYGIPQSLILTDLLQYHTKSPHLIIEVSHPSIAAQYGPSFLQTSDFLMGSPTALADNQVLSEFKKILQDNNHTLYVGVGALWGGSDIQKMADRGTLKGLKITMKKHPSMLKVQGHLLEKLHQVKDTPVTLYEGPVRDLCPLAPLNVNTMAAASIIAHNLGFDKVIGCLVADPTLTSHIVDIQVTGPGSHGDNFSVHTVRTNPAPVGAVTGKQTHVSFLSSLLAAHDKGPGIHLC